MNFTDELRSISEQAPDLPFKEYIGEVRESVEDQLRYQAEIGHRPMWLDVRDLLEGSGIDYDCDNDNARAIQKAIDSILIEHGISWDSTKADKHMRYPVISGWDDEPNPSDTIFMRELKEIRQTSVIQNIPKDVLDPIYARLKEQCVLAASRGEYEVILTLTVSDVAHVTNYPKNRFLITKIVEHWAQGLDIDVGDWSGFDEGDGAVDQSWDSFSWKPKEETKGKSKK